MTVLAPVDDWVICAGRGGRCASAGSTENSGQVPRLFAWADAHVHEETYEDAEYDQYEAECVRYDNAFTTRFLF